MIKRIFILALMISSSLGFAQHVTLSKASKVGDNTDKFLYKVDSTMTDKIYLGELEVFSAGIDEPALYKEFYKKAKTIGANGFSLKELETIDQSPYQMNANHYFVNLYEVQNKPLRDNTVYLISGAKKAIKVRFNNESLVLEPKSFIKVKLRPGVFNSVSVGRLLGARINFSYKEGQPVQYFLLLPGGIRANGMNTNGGLNIKSGDIISVERSYAEFLTTIYQRQK